MHRTYRLRLALWNWDVPDWLWFIQNFWMVEPQSTAVAFTKLARVLHISKV